MEHLIGDCMRNVTIVQASFLTLEAVPLRHDRFTEMACIAVENCPPIEMEKVCIIRVWQTI